MSHEDAGPACQALADRRCRPCEGGVEPLTAPEARVQLARIDPA